jgi:hypothetical protein
MVLGVLLKRAAFFLVVFSAILWSSCGSSNNSSSTVSKIKDRALFDNAASVASNGSPSVGILDIDFTPPRLFGSAVASLSMPEQMLIAPDRSFVLIYDDAQFNLTIFNSAQETTTGTLSLNYHSDSIVMSADGKAAYAAVPNNPEQNSAPGAVLSFNLSTGTSGAQIPIPGARRIALSPDGKSLLAFVDNVNTIYYVDLTATSLTAIPITGFNQPYTAVFGSDNQTAYVLNCGTECSGSTAPSIQPVTITPTAQTLGTPLAVPGATVAYLNGSTLYVAGNDLTQAAGSQGVLSVVNVSNMSLTSSTAIADGLHNKITSFANKLWIGSWNCTTTNCLSIYDLSSSKASLGTSIGNVTALTPAPLKQWIYVVQGGEIYQYDPSTLTNTIPYDLVGKAWDIKLLDQ